MEKSTMGAGNQEVKTLGKTTIDIAITGVTGAGKSSLVNALRGLSDFAEGAAKTNVIEETKEPMGYPHPTISNMTVWDLPGIGTRDFKAKDYLEKVNYSQYDFFIIVASNRFTNLDVQLSHAIKKMEKRFYYVHSKIDESIKNEKRNLNFNEEAVVQNVRMYCLENLVRAGFSSPEVFLISSWYREKYDFPRLQRTLQNEMEILRRKISWPAVPPDSETNGSLESSRRTMGGRSSTPEQTSARAAGNQGVNTSWRTFESPTVQRYLEELNVIHNVNLNIAITGVSGAGKSSLINALRNMSDYEEGAAKTGVRQTTMDIHRYPHPAFPKVTLWDLPGIGTPRFRPNEYLKKVHFSQYDFFIIVASTHFTENDVLLAHEIKKMKKKYYFVRSKMDASIDSERSLYFDGKKTLEKIRNYYCENLRRVGESSPRVFLISRWHLNKYDFPRLQRALMEELDDLKRHALILAMPVFSREILEQKKAAMEALIWKLSFVSCGIGAVPIPGLSLVSDISILVSALKHFYKVFCLDEDSLRRVARMVGKDLRVLRAAIKKSPMSSEITPDFVISLLSKSLLCGTLMLVEQIFDFVPVIGSLVGGGSSFFTTYYMLKGFLGDIVEDAENVRATAAAP